MEVGVIITGGLGVRSLNRLALILTLILVNIVVLAQTQRPAPAGIIQGIVQSGGTAVPGVTVTATNTATNEKLTTSTDLNGQYQLRLAAIGSYNVETSMAAFAPSTKTAEISEASAPVRMDFDVTLSSRTQNASAQPRQTVGFRGRGAQTLQARQTETSDASQENQSEELTAQIPNDVQVPGFAQDAPTESVAVLGNTAESTFGNNFNFDREQIQQSIDQQFGQGGRGGPEGFGAPQNGGPDGGPGGLGGFAGGGRGGGNQRGGGGGGGGGGGRGFAVGATRPRGNLSYTLSDSALDAAPYSLTGQPSSKPEYIQNRFSASVGGPLVIPKLLKSTTTNYTVTYN